MVKARKRKTALVDTQFAADILSDELRAEQLRSNPRNLEDDNLFVEDTKPDDAQIHLPARPRKRPRASKEKRMTRAEAIITGSKPLPFAPGSSRSKSRLPDRKQHSIRSARVLLKTSGDDQVVRTDAWSAVDTTSDWAEQNKIAATRPKNMDIKNRPQIAAVEVDPAGCSYNPDHELHQDAVAQAVATEHLKQIDKELQPKAPPLSVTEEQAALKDMEIGLFDEDSSDEDDLAGARNDADASNSVAGNRTGEKKTIKDRARQLRHKQMEKEHKAKRSLKRLRHEIDSLQQLQGSVEDQAEACAARRARRQADIEQRHAQEPPKLGRHKFTPAPLQVLATDDLTGSLRTLKTVPVVAKDRFKSLQKRGLIHVTVKQHWVKPTTRRVKRFEKKATQDRDEITHREISRLQKKNKVKRNG